MSQLTFDSGVISLAVNGNPDKVFSFNPSDAKVYEGFFEMVTKTPETLKDLSDQEEKLIEEKGKLTDEEYIKKVFVLKNQVNNILRDQFDNIFGQGMANVMFDRQNVTALGRNGDFIFINALMAIVPYFERETKVRRDKVKDIIQDHKPKAKKKK